MCVSFLCRSHNIKDIFSLPKKHQCSAASLLLSGVKIDRDAKIVSIDFIVRFILYKLSDTSAFKLSIKQSYISMSVCMSVLYCILFNSYSTNSGRICELSLIYDKNE